VTTVLVLSTLLHVIIELSTTLNRCRFDILAICKLKRILLINKI